jgi:hypothetical protein
MQESNIVIVPDYGGVGPRHWLAHWRSNHPRIMRFAEHDPRELTCRKWLRGIDDAVAACGPPTTVVAHGLGCLAVAHWAHISKRRIDAAMLVSVADPSSEKFPKAAADFCPMPRAVLPFRTLVVAAETDGNHQHALDRAHDWDATMVVVGRISHDTDPRARQTWDEGLSLLWNLAGLELMHRENR